MSYFVFLVYFIIEIVNNMFYLKNLKSVCKEKGCYSDNKVLRFISKMIMTNPEWNVKGDAAPQFYGVFGQSALYKTFVFRHIHD